MKRKGNKRKVQEKKVPYCDSNRCLCQQNVFSLNHYVWNRSSGAAITTLISRVIINLPVPPVFNNTLTLYSGKTLPPFVTRTVYHTISYFQLDVSALNYLLPYNVYSCL